MDEAIGQRNIVPVILLHIMISGVLDAISQSAFVVSLVSGYALVGFVWLLGPFAPEYNANGPAGFGCTFLLWLSVAFFLVSIWRPITTMPRGRGHLLGAAGVTLVTLGCALWAVETRHLPWLAQYCYTSDVLARLVIPVATAITWWKLRAQRVDPYLSYKDTWRRALLLVIGLSLFRLMATLLS